MLPELVTQDFKFTDPYHEIHGVDKVMALFNNMLDSLDSPRFEMLDWSVNGDVLLARWKFHCRLKKATFLGHFSVEGISYARMGPDGKVSEHIDYWDTAGQIYSKIPVISLPFKLLGWAVRRGTT